MTENRHHKHMTVEASEYRNLMQSSLACKLWRGIAIASLLVNLLLYSYIKLTAPDAPIKTQSTDFKLDTDTH